MDNRVFLKSEAVKGQNYPPFHPNCRCRAVDKDGKPIVLLSKEFINSMMKSYGFSAKEARLISEAYRLLLWEATDKQMKKQEKIHHIFLVLAPLCSNYSGEAKRWWLVAEVLSTSDAKMHLIELGMDSNSVESLYQAINNQHKNAPEIEKDFAHELIQYAIFSNTSTARELFESAVGNLDALSSYKGDVFSANMETDDMNSDIDANNIYRRLINSNEDFLETISEYNNGVNHGTINRFDEFLKSFGNGDAELGLKYIEEDLNSVDRGAHYLSETYEDGKKGFAIEALMDIFSKEKSNANAVFDENKKNVQANGAGRTIIEIRNKFLDYIKAGMSK